MRFGDRGGGCIYGIGMYKVLEEKNWIHIFIRMKMWIQIFSSKTLHMQMPAFTNSYAKLRKKSRIEGSLKD